MLDLKKSLYTYMQNMPGSFVGFFDLVSEVLQGIGNEWVKHAETTKDNLALGWGNTFLAASKTVKGVSESLEKIRIEHDSHVAETTIEDPAMLIQNFKDRVMKEIKNAG